MAEYYPLLAKAVGRLPNSTPESRRVVYERARKALIGQLRTQHPPVPDEDIDRESVELDRAVERLEAELASGAGPVAPPPADSSLPPAGDPSLPTQSGPQASPAPPPENATPQTSQRVVAPSAGTGAIGPAAKRPIPPLRPRVAGASPFAKKVVARPAAPIVPPPAVPPRSPAAPPAPTAPAVSSPPPPPTPSPEPPPTPAEPSSPAAASQTPRVEAASATNGEASAVPPVRVKAPRSEPSRPIAPQPEGGKGPKRRLWIIPAGIGVVVALVAIAAWKLRDRPGTIARTKPAEQTQSDSGKIAERIGAPHASTGAGTDQTAPGKATPAPSGTAGTQQQANIPPVNNPEIPVAHRAALLVEAPNEPNKVKTFLGTVVWKLDNVAQGTSDAVGLAVEADIDLPDDKMRATVTFEKNADASLAASHTIKVQFSVEPGSYSGDVKQISTPQMRPEANPSGEPLAGVTVPVVPNTFLVGLSPGNAEAANIDLMRRLQWIDIPMLLDNGKIAKLTFEKSDSGQRDLGEAFTAWQK